MLKEDTKRIGL